MEDVLAMLSAYLTAPPRRIDKAPDGFDAQLKRTCEATTSDIRVLLLEAGFQAWYAYLIANPETRKAVDALPSPQLQEVAHEICKTELHKDMNEHFQHVFYGSDRADHRSRRFCRPSPHFPLQEREREREIDATNLFFFFWLGGFG